MTKKSVTILTTFVFPMLLFFGCNCEGNKKSPQSSGYSGSVNDSKEKGVFQFEVIADKSILTLDNSHKLKIENAWVENKWNHEHYIIGTAPVIKFDSLYQLIMILNFDSAYLQIDNGYYYFIGTKPLDFYISYNCHNYYSDRIDTIKVPIYKEPTPILPSKTERKAFDTITFVKRQVNG